MIVKATKEEIEMNMPGFTAETSLYNVSTRYRATAKAAVYGGIVQPAGPFSDVFHPDQPVPFLYNPLYGNCLKRVCWPYVAKQWPPIIIQHCEWVIANC
jgi:hypothetical protein